MGGVRTDLQRGGAGVDGVLHHGLQMFDQMLWPDGPAQLRSTRGVSFRPVNPQLTLILVSILT